jgi:hypothetical protein
MQRRHALSLLGVAAAIPAGAAAAQDWCDADPAVPIKTPSNNTVVLYVVNSGPTAYRAELFSTRPSYTVAAAGAGTDVVLTLDFDAVRQSPPPALISEVWTGPQRTGTRLSSQGGRFGQSVVHRFQIATA